MATKDTIKLDTERPTHTSDFIKSDVEKAVFLGDPILDNMLTTILAVSAETWANRRRTLVLERLLAEKGISKEISRVICRPPRRTPNGGLSGIDLSG
jgi:hypothetical protein